MKSKNDVFVAFLITVVMLIASAQASAGIFDSIKTIVGGHIDDIRSRSTDDQLIGSYIDVIREGQIRENDPGQDAFHNASGTVQLRVIDGISYIQLDSDFTSTPGPDYHVYISETQGIKTESDFMQTTQVELGRLIKGSGASYYEIKGIHPINIGSVTIWCKAFGEFIGSADL